uniref:Agouti signaling protein, nonagouti homolog (mouse) 2b n=1 Tax=Astyanax mexicanus TaxID=7994 RepID=A0A8B9HX25_ASTMX
QNEFSTIIFYVLICETLTININKLSVPYTGARNQDKPKRLFARTRYLPTKQLHVQRPKPETVGAAPVPVRRCAGLMESCSGHILCCDSCASCHCRLFNTICHCWRLGNCTKKT